MTSTNNLATSFSTLPQLCLTDRQRFDLELLLVGGFAPLTGFLNQNDYESVVADMHLSDGTLWPMPIVLDVPNDCPHQVGDEIVLTTPAHLPLARMSIESRYTPHKDTEAQSVYGTTDRAHPGVAYLYDQTGSVYLGGTVTLIQRETRSDFAALRRTPEEVKALFKERGWSQVIGFQTRNPMHRAHFELVKRAHESIKAPVLIHPVVGLTKEGDIDYATRVHTYKVVCDSYGKTFTELSLLPLAMRMAGPREALWHMLIRKNYGCTHFIVGRDHAGPGKGSDGTPLYGPYEARELALAYAKEAGVVVVASDELAYSPEKEAYVASGELTPGETVLNISGTEFRAKLAAKESIPEWFSFPETIAYLEAQQRQSSTAGAVVFLTGLSGSGKSTIAEALFNELTHNYGRTVTVLDGDVIRHHLSSELGFSKAHRDLNVTRVGFVASEVARHGGIAICSLIAPYHSARAAARALVVPEAVFLEVHVSTPLAVCEARDVKGLYQKARAGIITGFTGIDDPYEVPGAPECSIDTSQVSVADSVASLIDLLTQKGVL